MRINNTFGYDRAQRGAPRRLVRGRAGSWYWRGPLLIPDLGRFARGGHAQRNAASTTLCTTNTLITFFFQPRLFSYPKFPYSALWPMTHGRLRHSAPGRSRLTATLRSDCDDLGSTVILTLSILYVCWLQRDTLCTSGCEFCLSASILPLT
jgi:hypothetical protein